MATAERRTEAITRAPPSGWNASAGVAATARVATTAAGASMVRRATVIAAASAVGQLGGVGFLLLRLRLLRLLPPASSTPALSA